MVVARSAAASSASARAVVALASPSAVRRYRCRRGRPGTGSSCQHVVVLTDDTDWEEIRELVTDSYRILAPKKLTALLD